MKNYQEIMAGRARAIIIKDNKIILIKRVKANQTYWVFPGGGIEPGETEEDALIREIKEELGLDVKVKELFLERPSEKPGTNRAMEYFFTADVVSGKLGTGNGPEYQHNAHYDGTGTREVDSIDINDLEKIDLKPKEVKNLVLKLFKQNT